MEEIKIYENILKNGNNQNILECYNNKNTPLGFLICCSLSLLKFSDYKNQKFKKEEEKENLINIKLLCNWCSSKDLAKLWLKMGNNNHGWNNLNLVDLFEEKINIDYYIIINGTNEPFVKEKSILFRMEPKMYENPSWGIWSKPDINLMKIFAHENREFNNIEWHISKTYEELKKDKIEKKYNIISTIVSEKYKDPGQMKRIDFIKFLEEKMEIHVYGNNKWNYKNYKKELPYHKKDEGLLPYKYTFNAENYNENYYVTEKLIDGILSECLVFYYGCENVKEIIDEKAFIKLNLSNFENDYNIIEKAISEDWYNQRLPFIKKEKERILDKLQFFPRLEKIINN